MGKLRKEEKEEYDNFCNFPADLSEYEINEIDNISCDDEVITPPSLLTSYFENARLSQLILSEL